MPTPHLLHVHLALVSTHSWKVHPKAAVTPRVLQSHLCGLPQQPPPHPAPHTPALGLPSIRVTNSQESEEETTALSQILSNPQVHRAETETLFPLLWKQGHRVEALLWTLPSEVPPPTNPF